MPLDTAPPTALFHTILHIVCLPPDDSYINHHSAKCHASIHELRCLDRNTQNQTLHPHPPPNQLLRRRPNSSQSTPSLPSLSSDHSTHLDPCFLYLFGVVLPNGIILFAYSLAQKQAASVLRSPEKSIYSLNYDILHNIIHILAY